MRKKVLFLIESLSGGGAEKVLMTILKNLDRTRFDITLCSILNTGVYLEEIPSYVYFKYILPNHKSMHGFRLFVYKIKYKIIYNLLSPRLFYKLFVPKGNDLEVAFLEGNVTRFLSGSTNRYSQKVAWVHTDLASFHWTAKLYDNLRKETDVYNLFDRVVCVSEHAKRSFLKEFPEVRTPLSVLYNPVDREEIIRLAKQNAEIPEKKTDKVRMISLGRLTYQKAYDRLLRVFMRLKKRGFDMELWILGEGEEKDRLKKYIEDNDLSSDVTLWGFQTNPYKFMSKCDFFVCSSFVEGYSTAATEAIILGLPVITTDCSGMRELLADGAAGIITGNSDEGLYDGLSRVLSDSQLLQSLRNFAIAHSSNFNLKTAILRIDNFLDDLRNKST